MLQFHALGAVTVAVDGGELSVGGPRQRRLVAMLLIHRNTVVSVDRLAEAVFAGEPTPAAGTTLRSYVARLRRVIDADGSAASLATQAPGYVLRVAPGAFDVDRFERLVGEARARLDEGAAAFAVTALQEARSLWRGEAYAEFADEDWARPEVQRLSELRVVADERLIDAEMACGRAAEVIPALEALIAAHPLRDGFHVQLATALYRSGRQVDALRVVRDHRRRLVEEAGLDVSPTLADLERRVLAQDPSLLLHESAGIPLRGYRLGERLGTGRDGTVHAAWLPGVERDLAVRRIRADVADQPAFVRTFEATVRRVAALQDVAAVTIHDYWREPGAAYVVMRRLRGGTLADRLHRGPLTGAEVAALVVRIGGALAAAAASGVVHGRVIPQSVLFDDRGEPWLTDFALAPPDDRLAADDVHDFALLIDGCLTDPRTGPSAAVPSPVADVLARAMSTSGRPPMAALVTALVAGLSHDEDRCSEPGAVNPYKGLLAFQEADTVDFFGRGPLIDEALARLGRDDLRGRLLLVVGGSGTGKSSLVRAGLLPRLRHGDVPGAHRWFIATMLPGGSPFKELAECLRSVAVDEINGLADQLAEEGGIDRVIRRVLPDDGELLLVVDQFEELFTLAAEDDQRTFLDGITHAVSAPDSRLRVVATLRADYYDRPLAFHRFGAAVGDTTLTIIPMAPAELEAAIVQPAQRVGGSVEPALVAELVAAVVDQPAALPSLQFTLFELAARHPRPQLTLDDYRQLGGVAGAIASRAERVYNALDDDGRAAARLVFERLAVVGAEGEPTRRWAPRSELAGLATGAGSGAAIDTWAQARLLTLDRNPRTREPTVDLAHEALLREWPRLRGWIEEDRDSIVVLTHLREAAAGWDALGRDAGAVYRGARLQAALDVTAARAAEVPALEREFLDASRGERDRETDEEARRVARQARSNRVLRIQLAVVAVALVVALVAGYLAFDQRRQAVEESRTAVARELAAAADANLVDDPERSTLLALAAIDTTRAHGGRVLPEAVEALHRAVSSSRVLLDVDGLGGTLDWSPDGRTFATEGPEESGVLDIRDATTGAAVAKVHAHDIDVNDVGYSGDGTRLASAGDDGAVRVWEPNTGQLVFEHVQPEGGTVWGPSLNRDGTLVAAAWPDADRVRVIDVASGTVVTEVDVAQIFDTSFSPDGSRLVLGSWNGSSEVIDVRTGAAVLTLADDSIGTRESAWSPDGRRIALAQVDGAMIFDAATGRQSIAFTGHKGPVSSVDWSPDGTRLATASDDGTARVSEVTDAGVRELLSVSAQDLRNGVRSVAFGPRGDRIMTGDWAVTSVKVWDVSDTAGAEVANYAGGGAYTANAVAFSDDGALFFQGLDAGVAIRVDGGTGATTSFGPAPSSDALDRFEPSPDGRLLATSGDGLPVTVWEVATGRHLFTLDQTGYTRELAWNRDGTLLAAALIDGSDSRVLIVDASGTVVATLRDEQSLAFTSVSFDPSGTRLATTRVDPRDDPAVLGVRIWDWRAGRVVLNFPTSSQYVTFDSTGQHLVTRRFLEGIADVWDASTGKLLTTLSGHTGAITDVTFDADGSRIATTSLDGTARIWDARTGEQQLALRGPTGVQSVAFSPDGSELASVDGDGVVRVWALELDDLIAIAKRRLTRSLTDPECRQYLHVDRCADG